MSGPRVDQFTASVFIQNPTKEECVEESQHSTKDLVRSGYVWQPKRKLNSLISYEEYLEKVHNETVNEERTILPIILSASSLGDFPVQYEINCLEAHQLPVVGVYIDKRIIPGFKYRIRRLLGEQNNNKVNYLFNGETLTLLNIGRGYGKRFTFENSQNFPEEENYFYSDNNLEGYTFEPQVVFHGQKFTILDVNHEIKGVLQVIEADKKQIELSSKSTNDQIEKRHKVKFIAKVEFYDRGTSQQISVDGTVISTKYRKEDAAKTKIIDVNIQHHRYYLKPGYEEQQRILYINGKHINDVPTTYTITGLMPYELPIIGTYVDPRVLPGFTYRVRPLKRKQHLFKGQALQLQSISMGYAKKLSFASASQLNSNNYLWSDNYQDGLALETRAVTENMTFQIAAGNKMLGVAKVFRVDFPQIEDRTEKVTTDINQHTYIKYIHVDIMCHVKLDINESGVFQNEGLMRVYGLAMVRKEPGVKDAYLERIDNVGLDSQLNVIFACTQTELTFIPVQR